MKKKISIIGLLLFLVCSVVGTARTKEKVTQDITMYGMGISLLDSTIFVTQLQTLKDVEFASNKFLEGRMLYSEQLRLFLMKKGYSQVTCAVSFHAKPNRIAKQYQKVISKYRKDKHILFETIPADEFVFEKYQSQTDSQPATNQ